MFGQLSHEQEANVPASDVWEIYGTLELAKLVVKELPDLVLQIDVIEGDGGVGTILKLTFPPGTAGFSYGKEKFVKVDNEKRVKETVVIEGGFLNLGFTSYLVRFEIVGKGDDSCIIKTTIEYDVKEEAAANASYVTAEIWEKIATAATDYITKNKAKNAN